MDAVLTQGKRKRAPEPDLELDSDIEILSSPPPTPPPSSRTRRRKGNADFNAACGPKSTTSNSTGDTTVVNATSTPCKAPTKANLTKIGVTVQEIVVDGHRISTTPAFMTFWKYAAERQNVEDRRRAGEKAPWTEDALIATNRFCSVFRVADAGCQFLIREVIEKGSQVLEDVIFRVVLYNFFTRIETYKALEQEFGPLTWKRFDIKTYSKFLDKIQASGKALYTPAYQRPAPTLGESCAHDNHLQLVDVLMRKEPNLVYVVDHCKYLSDAYDWINCLPGMGDFMAHQLLLDLTYAKGLARFHPNDFAVAGKGAVAGIKKCFDGVTNGWEIEIMRWMYEHQDEMFAKMGLAFGGLKVKGKRMGLQLCDIEHTLCEVHKYEALRQSRGRSRGRKFDAFNARALDREVTLPKAWNDRRRLKEKIKPGKHVKVGKEFVINRLLEKKTMEDGSIAYLVDWLGYSAEHRSWEPAVVLKEDAPFAIEEYEKGKGKQRK